MWQHRSLNHVDPRLLIQQSKLKIKSVLIQPDNTVVVRKRWTSCGLSWFSFKITRSLLGFSSYNWFKYFWKSQNLINLKFSVLVWTILNNYLMVFKPTINKCMCSDILNSSVMWIKNNRIWSLLDIQEWNYPARRTIRNQALISILCRPTDVIAPRYSRMELPCKKNYNGSSIYNRPYWISKASVQYKRYSILKFRPELRAHVNK